MPSNYKTPEEAEEAWRKALAGILVGLRDVLRMFRGKPEEQLRNVLSSSLVALVKTLAILVNEGPDSKKQQKH